MKALWTPSSDSMTSSAMARFMSKLLKESVSFAEFHKWSVQNFEHFWKSLLWESSLVFIGTPETTLIRKASRTKMLCEWFPDVELNFAQNLLEGASDQAIVGILENGAKTVYSRQKLRDEVRALQLYLKSQGFKKGDRAAAYVANVPQAVVAMLAVTSLGGVWSSCSPDFGYQGVLDRFAQINPKVLFVVDGYFYNGKLIDMKQKNAALVESLGGGVDCVQIGVLNDRGSRFSEVCKDFKNTESLEFEMCRFSDPLFIMFSSGTTGAPKSIVHSVGGTLLQIYKEHTLHCDLRPNEKILYYTTCGWMMWNWLVSAMASGATVYCYDGSPTANGIDTLWEILGKEQIDIFGTSAKFIGSCRQANYNLNLNSAPLKARLVLSTGSPLLPEDFDYFYSKIDPASKIQLSSICGGTDILSCFMLGNPLTPVYRSQIQGAGLGMDVAALNDRGQRVLGERGELVCGTPFPSMPIGFLNDEGGKKYFEAYFERFEGYWHHGDFVSIEPSGGLIVYGRSDATLNPGGVRIGSAEIYRSVETLPEVQDSLVVGCILPSESSKTHSKELAQDEQVVLFVKLKPGFSLSPQMVDKIKKSVRASATPRHVPSKVFAVNDIPYTLSGKKVELAVKSILSGVEPKNVEALANPESLEHYRKLRLELFKP